ARRYPERHDHRIDTFQGIEQGSAVGGIASDPLELRVLDRDRCGRPRQRANPVPGGESLTDRLEPGPSAGADDQDRRHPGLLSLALLFSRPWAYVAHRTHTCCAPEPS